MVALADETVQLLDGESFIEVDFFEFGSLCAKPTLRVAAAGSGGFGVELEGGHSSLSDGSVVLTPHARPCYFSGMLWRLPAGN